MGQTSSSAVKAHMETASKTGALVLTDRKLTEIPNLSSMTKILRTLDLSSNKLQCLPDSICTMKNLKHLTVNSNKLVTLPNEIGCLNKLESISLMNNTISRLPSSISELSHLKSLIISSNNIDAFPILICGLPHLDVVDLSSNMIQSIPDEIKDFQGVELNLNQNRVSYISPEIAQCSRLKVLKLEENVLQLQGIPEELLTNSQVSLLSVNGNIFSMKDLEELDAFDSYMERYTAVKKKMY